MAGCITIQESLLYNTGLEKSQYKNDVYTIQVYVKLGINICGIDNLPGYCFVSLTSSLKLFRVLLFSLIAEVLMSQSEMVFSVVA